MLTLITLAAAIVASAVMALLAWLFIGGAIIPPFLRRRIQQRRTAPTTWFWRNYYEVSGIAGGIAFGVILGFLQFVVMPWAFGFK
ncbi:hypothetical protein JDN41_16575 [Rhodomicrobium udaipurense]|uniref:Uncharacterized protein n=1 Tax=Rhodomicrobium udaipurense TaxID=1202716 RepID=A0A8I1GHS9_9HYPH|nr:hypothetical protein [Rhodomicrobium udaipurense]MBJ7545168.1 hypothetical protein [Rhodomicrobium udaipurense]